MGMDSATVVPTISTGRNQIWNIGVWPWSLEPLRPQERREEVDEQEHGHKDGQHEHGLSSHPIADGDEAEEQGEGRHAEHEQGGNPEGQVQEALRSSKKAIGNWVGLKASAVPINRRNRRWHCDQDLWS